MSGATDLINILNLLKFFPGRRIQSLLLFNSHEYSLVGLRREHLIRVPHAHTKMPAGQDNPERYLRFLSKHLAMHLDTHSGRLCPHEKLILLKRAAVLGPLPLLVRRRFSGGIIDLICFKIAHSFCTCVFSVHGPDC